MPMLFLLTLPFYDFCGFRCVAVNSAYKLQSGSQMSVRPPVGTSTKRFFDSNEIRYVGRGRRVMHDGMQYNPI